eukprot:4274529-Pleurochrysis_carterae.AAC.1
MGPDSVRTVLLGRKGALNLPSGFLLDSVPSTDKVKALGWEMFAQYEPAPIDRCPARYVTPPLEFAVDFGDPIAVTPPFVSLSGAK